MSLIYDNQEKNFSCLLKFGHCFNGAGELIVSKKLASGEMEEMLKGGDLTAPIRYVTFGSDYHDVETTAQLANILTMRNKQQDWLKSSDS